ncbi:MAG TPA: hypothetical protein IAA99_02960 [Candidatus Avibacteroides faecavium]|nr:hypothetical protein [Candidatus Avibacteroides faecavium]
MDNNNQLALIRPENIQAIMQAAPHHYDGNKASHDRCIDAGLTILNAVRTQGMSDDLDQQAAAFIDKARRTVKAMNERRSPVTKLFDEVRTAFTTLENEIDPARPGSIAHDLQQLRNQYAAQKRAEEERRLREEMARRQAEEAARKFRMDVEDDFKRKFQDYVNAAINRITQIDNAVTLENYDNSLAELHKIKAAVDKGLSAQWADGLHTTLRIPSGINVAEVENELKLALFRQFNDQYLAEVGDTVDYVIDRLPSKRANLEKMAQANAEEAARIKAEMEARQRAEAERMEKERQEREAEDKRKTEMEREAAGMSSLFDQQAAVTAYQPKTKVTKRINLLNPEGIMPVIALWWSKEGCTLTVDELARMFKKQIAFCEKLANKDGETIKHESVEYVDEVKAK